jgi:glycosyltransferase involved in cell wall biosynthesis
MKTHPKLSVLLPTKNVEDIISDVLDSVAWADEILVVDSFSADATVAVCQSHGARVLQHVYINSAKQKNWALPQCQHDWVLQIDSDEILEEGFHDELREKLSRVPDHVHAFCIPRKNHILGKWMQHSGIYPDYQNRLFRKDKGHWIEREVHAHVVVPGEVQSFDHHILHYGMPHFSKQIQNLDRYTRYEADEMLKKGRKFHLFRLLWHPWFVFFQRYMVYRGFLDGLRGFIYCVYLAFYDFLSYVKLWEIETLNLDHSPKN